MFAVVVGGTLRNNVIKLVVDRDRPDVVHLVEAAGTSFPSGHSAASMTEQSATVGDQTGKSIPVISTDFSHSARCRSASCDRLLDSTIFGLPRASPMPSGP